MRKIIIATLVFAAVCFAKFAGFGYDHGTNVIVHKNETFEIEGNIGKNELGYSERKTRIDLNNF